MVNETDAYRALMRKLERKRPYGRPRLKYDDNIHIHIKETGGSVCVLDLCGSGQGQALGS
jgi:hypothetical protein